MVKLTRVIMLGLSLVSAQAMADVVFEQDFEAGLGAGERTYSKYRNSYGNYVNTNNWGVHNGTQNPWTSGGDPYPNPNMQGNVLGHIDGYRGYSSGSGYHSKERSYYEIDLDLSASTGSKLSFDFDSWIDYDLSDGFNVIAYQDDGYPAGALDTAGFTLLTPTLDSDMQYDPDMNGNFYGQLDNVSGYVEGFNGHNPNMMMAGTAMFSLSQFDGQMITLRFSFGSNKEYYSNPEGINIDNILVSDYDTPPPPGPPGIPEPTGLSLLGLGLLGFIHRRKFLKA